MAKIKKWTEEEDNFIKENHLKMDNGALARKFEVTVKSIEGKIRRMKLKKPKLTEKSEKPKLAKKSEKKERLLIHQNIRCRTCFLADGYTEVEENCRYCGAKLFKLDVI
jgi:hypothetical protein